MPQILQQITPLLWLAQSDVYTTNSGIFFSEGQACLIDPAVLPDDIHAIKNLLGEQNLKAENLILTHHHWDHLFGPEHFPNVRVITHNAYEIALSGEGADRTLRQVQYFENKYKIARSKVFRFPVPDITFERSMTIQIGDLALDLIHAPGHATDQMVVFQPESGVLWAADMLSDLEIPFVEELQAYQHTLEMLNRLDVQVLIPGHGHVTGSAAEVRGRFEEDIAYLLELRQRVENGMQAGKTLEEIQADSEAMRFKHPEDNASPHLRNVEMAYREGIEAETE